MFCVINERIFLLKLVLILYLVKRKVFINVLNYKVMIENGVLKVGFIVGVNKGWCFINNGLILWWVRVGELLFVSILFIYVKWVNIFWVLGCD